MRNALNLEVMLAPPPRPWTLKPVQTLTPCHRRRQARASVPAEALEPHHETLGVELEIALQDLVDFRIAERAAVAVHQIEPQSAHRGADAGGRFRILRVGARDAGQLAALRLWALAQPRAARHAAAGHEAHGVRDGTQRPPE